MKIRQRRYGTGIAMLAMGALAVMAVSSLAMAQQAQWMKDAAKMMSDGWKQFNDGQRMVIQGKEMNDLVAVQMGFEGQMAQGNKIIRDGRNTQTQAATLFAQGEKTYLDNQANPSVAKPGLQMMGDSFHMANDGSKMITQGVAMNNQVAQAAGAADKFSQGNQVIQTGVATMASGAKLFMQGEDLFLKNK
jgi:hypothetical protein